LENTTAAGLGTITIGDATLSLFRSAATTTYPNLIVSAVGTNGLLTVDGSGVDAGTGTNSTYTLNGIQVDGTLTITRPTGGKGATVYNGMLSGSGTLVIGDNNGGVDLIVDNTSTSRGRVFFPNTNNTFNGHVQVLERGNFLNNTLDPPTKRLPIDAGGAITLLDQGSGSQTRSGASMARGSSPATPNPARPPGGREARTKTTRSAASSTTAVPRRGTIGITKNGTATQTLSGAGIRHNGITTVNNGTFKLFDTTAWASNIVFGAADSPVLEFAGSESYTMSRTITGGSANASLLKSSGGTLTLSGANTFTGSIRRGRHAQPQATTRPSVPTAPLSPWPTAPPSTPAAR
jgi:autotransporter-associated beta strand protein